MSDTLPDLLSAKDVHKMLKVSLPLVYRMAERGQLPCISWGCPGEGEKKPRTTVRFELDRVMKFIEEHRQK